MGALARLGLGYEAARERNPGHHLLLGVRLRPGRPVPRPRRARSDPAGGERHDQRHRRADGRGVRCGVSIADITAGMYAAFGIMLALRVKEKTGRGQAIDVSMLEGQLSLLGSMIGAYFADGEMPQPMGTAYKALLPYQTFRTKTRDLALAVGSEKLWKEFCPADRPARADRRSALPHQCRAREEPRHADPDAPGGVPHADLRGMGGACSSPRGIPMGAINTIAQVVKHPQVRGARGAGRDGPSARRQGAHGRRAGAAVGDAGLGAHARAAPRRAHRRGAARPARAPRGGHLRAAVVGRHTAGPRPSALLLARFSPADPPRGGRGGGGHPGSRRPRCTRVQTGCGWAPAGRVCVR